MFAAVICDGTSSSKEELHKQIESYRKEVCKDISLLAKKEKSCQKEGLSLPCNCPSIENIDSTKQQCIKEMLWQIINNENNEGEMINDGVTPLMLSCDRDLPNILQYLLSYVVISDKTSMSVSSLIQLAIVGHPNQKSSSRLCGGNTAAHYAVHSNSMECLKVLVHWEEEKYKNSSSFLLNQTNSHGDTPLMMAVAAGKTIITDPIKNNQTTNNLEMIRYILSQQPQHELILDESNQSGDTAMSLAYGHGHVDILREFLILFNQNQPQKYKVLSGHVDKCKQILRMSKFYIQQQRKKKTLLNPEDPDDEIILLEQRKNQVEVCLNLLRNSLEQEATINMNELLLMIEGEQDSKSPSTSSNFPQQTETSQRNRKKKGSKNKKLVAPNATERQIHSVKDDCNVQMDMPKEIAEISSINIPKFVTLSSGTVVSPTGAALLFPENSCICTEKSKIESSISNNFREQWREDHGEPSFMKEEEKTNNTIHNQFLEQCPEAESLCLDVSMLLLSSQKMAILLSPCQLECIGRFLEKQVSFVKEAQVIQSRVWEGLKNPTNITAKLSSNS